MLKFKCRAKTKYIYFNFESSSCNLKLDFGNGVFCVLFITDDDKIVSAYKYNFKTELEPISTIFSETDVFNFNCIHLNNPNNLLDIIDFPEPDEKYRDIILNNKIEYSEYEFHKWAQLRIYSEFPDELNVLGITLNGDNIDCINKKPLWLFSLPGTISNYLMQLEVNYSNIIEFQLLNEIIIDDKTIKFFKVKINFSTDSILYKISSDKYQKLFPFIEKEIIHFQYSNFENELDDYMLRINNKEYVEEYIEYNLQTRITKKLSLKAALGTEFIFIRYLYLSQANLNQFNRFNNAFKYKVLNSLLRVFYPSLIMYETGTNWTFDMVFPERYFIFNDLNYYYDLFNGLAFTKDNHRLTRTAPEIDWIHGPFTLGYWSNQI